MDATHGTNQLRWKLFTLMVRSEVGVWAPVAHILSPSRLPRLLMLASAR